jgi:hypothetical protein
LAVRNTSPFLAADNTDTSCCCVPFDMARELDTPERQLR